MSLDFEKLEEETRRPLPDRGVARKRRQVTLSRLSDLGVTRNTVAAACQVEPKTVKRWYGGGAPAGYAARIAVDRLSSLINHMETDLGLTDPLISRFLTSEPTKERGLELYISWTPEYEDYCRSLLMTGVVGNGLGLIEDRLRARFPERYDDIDTGQREWLTPETI